MKRLIIYFYVMSVFSCCNAQDYTPGNFQKVMPGDELVDASKITPHQVRFERENGNMTYRMDEVEKNNRELFRLSILLESGSNKFPDTIYFDKESFGFAGRTLINRRRGFHAKLSMQGKDLQASIKELPGRELDWKGDYTHEYPHGLFEISVLNYAIKTLPLEKGFKASVPVFVFSLEFPVAWIDVVVEGKEKLKINRKEYEAWKVNALGGKMGDKTFWISEKLAYPLKIHSKGLKAWTFVEEI